MEQLLDHLRMEERLRTRGAMFLVALRRAVNSFTARARVLVLSR